MCAMVCQPPQDAGVIATHDDRADGECWACGRKGCLEGAHLISRMLGGSFGPDNFALLCGCCHRAVPTSTDPAVMWTALPGGGM